MQEFMKPVGFKDGYSKEIKEESSKEVDEENLEKPIEIADTGENVHEQLAKIEEAGKKSFWKNKFRKNKK